MARDLFANRPHIRLFAYRAMFAITKALPLWSARLVGFFVGWIVWWLDNQGRRVVTRNLAHFVPTPEALRRSVRRSYINFCYSIAESFAMERIPDSCYRSPHFTLVDPWQVFSRRPRTDQTIFATVHCNWDFALSVYHKHRLIEKCHGIALSYNDERIDQLFFDVRARFGCHSLILDRAPLAALRAAKDGQHLCLLGERDYTGHGLAVSFGGAPTTFPVGPAALAVQAGVPLVPCMFARQSPERFMMIIGKPILPDPSMPKGPQVQAMTQNLATEFTRYLAAAPSQWVAFHDAWPSPNHHAS